MAVTAVATGTNPAWGIVYTHVTDSSADWAAVSNSTFFYDKADGLVHYKNSSGVVAELFGGADTNFANTDLTLTASRTHDLNGNTLTLDNGQITIQGAGSTSATKSLLVENSSGTDHFTVFDDGTMGFGTGTIAGKYTFEYDTANNGLIMSIKNTNASLNSGTHLTIYNPQGVRADIGVGGNNMAANNDFAENALYLQANSGLDMAFTLIDSSKAFKFYQGGSSGGAKDNIYQIEANAGNSQTYHTFGFTNSANAYYAGNKITHHLTTLTAGSEESSMLIQTSNSGALIDQIKLVSDDVIQRLPSAVTADGNLFNNSVNFYTDGTSLKARYKDNGGAASDLTIGGEVNTASNVGGGEGLFSGKSGVDLQFKSLTSTGGTVTFTNTSNTVNLESPKPTLSKTFTLDAPTSSDDVTIFRTDVAITVQEVIAVSVGTTPSTTYQLKHHTDRSNAGNALTISSTTTSTTTGNTATLSDATIPANSWVWFESTAASGTNVILSIDIRYTED